MSDILEEAASYQPYNAFNDGPLVARLATEIASLRAALHDSQQGEECGKAVIARLRAELAKLEGELATVAERADMHARQMVNQNRRLEAAEARALAAEARMGEVVKAWRTMVADCRHHLSLYRPGPLADADAFLAALAKENDHDH